MAVTWEHILFRGGLVLLLFVALCMVSLSDAIFVVYVGIFAFVVSVWPDPVIVIVLSDSRAPRKPVIAPDVHKAIPRIVPAA